MHFVKKSENHKKLQNIAKNKNTTITNKIKKRQISKLIRRILKDIFKILIKIQLACQNKRKRISEGKFVNIEKLPP